MFDPANDFGERLAVFRVSSSELRLAPDKWHELHFDWDLSARKCLLRAGDAEPVALSLHHPTLNGLSYLRFRSTAKNPDPQGMLVDRVRVIISNPFAPHCTSEDQAAHEHRYIENVVPTWED